MYREEANKIALSSNDHKRLQTFDRITTYLHGTNAFKVCESEMVVIMKYDNLALHDKNRIKKTNQVFKASVAKCMMNRSIRFLNGEIFTVMKYKEFLPDNIDHIKKQTGFLRRLT